MTFDPQSAPWRKSTYSGGSQTECVEVAPMAGVVGIRDTKNRPSGHLTVPTSTWQAFITATKTGSL